MMRVTRRHLQLGLALLWLLDGALQCQPFMFSRSFARTIIAPAGQGQPAIVAAPVHWTATVITAHPAATNAAFAGVQLALGVGLLSRRTAKAALAASLGWALGVWWLGEGIGGLTSGETLLTGAPGAALLYGVIAMLARPTRDGDSDAPPAGWAVAAWSSLWLVGAGLQIAAGNDTGTAFQTMFRDAATASPAWIARLDTHLAHLAIPDAAVAATIAMFVLIAMWSLLPGGPRRLAIAAGIAISSAAWLLVQGLGDLTTGQATDPNTGPLIALLAAAALGVARPDPLASSETTPITRTSTTTPPKTLTKWSTECGIYWRLNSSELY